MKDVMAVYSWKLLVFVILQVLFYEHACCYYCRYVFMDK